MDVGNEESKVSEAEEPGGGRGRAVQRRMHGAVGMGGFYGKKDSIVNEQ